MITCIIVDDEEDCRVLLKELLARRHPEVEVAGEAGSAAEAYKQISGLEKPVDLVFLDIQMPVCDGFGFLNMFAHSDFRVVFTTAFDQYAIKAIRYSALDYLLKPIDPEELHEALERYDRRQGQQAMKELRHRINAGNYFDKLTVNTLSDVKFVEVDAIRYVESENSYSTIHLDSSEQIVSSKSIGFYEDLLSDRNFFRCHNSYLINIGKVTRLVKGNERMVELDHKVLLHVSDRRKDKLQHILGL
jgi:two-component system, LytTR family, response regulator